MGKAHLMYRRRKKTGFAEKGAEAGVALAVGRVLAYARRGKVKKTLLWFIPMAAAALLAWRIRK